MEVYKILEKVQSEIIYEDTLEFEFKKNEITYKRKMKFKIS